MTFKVYRNSLWPRTEKAPCPGARKVTEPRAYRYMGRNPDYGKLMAFTFWTIDLDDGALERFKSQHAPVRQSGSDSEPELWIEDAR